MTSSTPTTPQRLLRLREIIGDRKQGIDPIIPISKSAWWAGVRDGRFPKPIKLGPRTTVWKAEDVLALVSGNGLQN